MSETYTSIETDNSDKTERERMVMTIEEKQREFLEKFDTYEDEFDKYGYVIFLGSQLKAMPENWKTDENLYAGCLSKIWIHGELKNGKIFLSADSDTLIVKGLLYILRELIQGRTVEEVRNAKITLFDDLDMESVLNETRRKGMKGLVSWILDGIKRPVRVRFLDSDGMNPKIGNGDEKMDSHFLQNLIEKELDRSLTLLGYPVMSAEESSVGEASCILVRVNENMKEEKDSFHILAKPVGDSPKEVLQLLKRTGEKQSLNIVLLEGGSLQGCLYAVYEFLEQLGIRFYIQEDVFPAKAQEKKICELNLDYTKKPLFEIRGLLPFHDFPEGPDWWEKENYNRVMMQMIKMKGNFLGYHVYPENEKEPDKMTAEPLVWIGLPEDVDEKGKVKSAYPVQHFRTEGDSWGYHHGKTSEYPFGLGRFFDKEDMSVSYMKNGSEKTYEENLAASKTEDAKITFENYQEVFNKSGQFFSEVFQDTHRLGIKNCIGTETPLTIPLVLKKQAEEKNMDSKEMKKSFYEGMFKRIGQLYPVDYYWMWTPEDWTWKGNTLQGTENTIEDVTCALQVKQKLEMIFNWQCVDGLWDRRKTVQNLTICFQKKCRFLALTVIWDLIR